MFKKLFIKPKGAKEFYRIIQYSNVIQYDEMEYPLRLVMIDIGNGLVDHVWMDHFEKEGDVVLQWTKPKEENTNE